jgi:hypothetical protein
MGIWPRYRRFWAECFPPKYSLTRHLTPFGWYEGPDIPRDRVETWRALVEQRANGWRRDVTWWCIWISPIVSGEVRDALREKYPVGGRARFVSRMHVGEPLDRLPTHQPQGPDRPAERRLFPPALRIYWIIGLVALAALGIVLAAPHVQRSYWGAYLAGKCSGAAEPPECRARRAWLNAPSR